MKSATLGWRVILLAAGAFAMTACGGQTPGEETQATPAEEECDPFEWGSCTDCFARCVRDTAANPLAPAQSELDVCTQACTGMQPPSSAGGTSSGGTSGSGGAGAGGNGGTAGDPGTGGTAGDPGMGGNTGLEGQVVTVETTPFTIPPGGEVFKCENFVNPFGSTVAVQKTTSDMTAGSHHMFVFQTEDNQPRGIHDCSGLEFGVNIHSAQTPQQAIEYPPGVARLIEGGKGLRVLAHYLNTSQSPVEVSIKIDFEVAKANSVEHYAGSVFFNQPSIYIPPHSQSSVNGNCTLPYDAKLLGGVSHMHQYATNFVATASSGEMLYQTTQWEEPEPAEYNPPLELKGGTTVNYTCTYNNFSDQVLTFGDSAKYNEMCIFSGTYYPAPNGQSITCLL